MDGGSDNAQDEMTVCIFIEGLPPKACPTFISCCFGSTAMSRLCDMISGSNGLSGVVIKHCTLTNELASSLCKALSHACSSLRSLTITDGIDISMCEAFRAAIASNLSLRECLLPFDVSGLNDMIKQNVQVQACQQDVYETKISLAKRGLLSGPGIPESIFQMVHLTRLDVSHNNMTSLSSELRRLSSLTELVARGNRLASLPPELIYVRRLRVLDVQDNCLQEVPLCVGWLNDVEVLNFRGNLISQEPPECLGALERLRDLDVSCQDVETPWQPPKKIPPRGEALVAWLQQRLQVESIAARFRVVVLGEPQSGKTALVEALASVAGKMTASFNTKMLFSAGTEGVSLSHVYLPSKNLEIRFWDFLSSASWSSNQAFFSSGAIYLVCFDLRQSVDHSNVGFWISLVVSRAPGARIVLVGTHLDDPLCDRSRLEAYTTIVQQSFMERFSNVRELHMVSATNLRNCKDLLSAITHACASVRKMQEDGSVGFEDSTVGRSSSKLLRNISSKFKKMTGLVRPPSATMQPVSPHRPSSIGSSNTTNSSASSPGSVSPPAEPSGGGSTNDLHSTSSASSTPTPTPPSASPTPPVLTASIASISSTISSISSGSSSSNNNGYGSGPSSPTSASAPSSPNSEDVIEEGIPPSFVVFEQKLFALRLAVSPPIIKWKQFEALANHSGIPASKKRHIANYLQDLGCILYFCTGTDAEGRKLRRTRSTSTGGTVRKSGVGLGAPLSRSTGRSMRVQDLDDSLVVLDMQWLMRLFASVTTWQNHTVASVPRVDLLGLWDTNMTLFPVSLRKTMFWLLQRFEVCFQINETRLFVPSLLEDSRTNLDLWPQRVVPAVTTQLSRTYNFDVLPLGFGARFMAAIMRMGWDAVSGWKNGMILRNQLEMLLLEINPAQHSLRLTMRSPATSNGGQSLTLPLLAESLSTLIRDGLHTKVQIEVTCMHCIAQGSYDPYVFDMEDLVAQVAEGEYFAYCRSINPVRIYSMAPEISLDGLSAQLIPHASIELFEKLGDGSFSIVTRGRWKNEDVAVKLMKFEGTGDDERRKVFSEWRREVETMRSLQHTNIVTMRGLCVDPICLVLELCNMGDLFAFLHSDAANDPAVQSWRFRVGVALDIARGMRFLHSVTPPIIHRDLKTPNVLLNRDKDGRITAKVSDFGLSVRFGLVTQIVGSQVANPVWNAPEVMRGEAYNEKCDVYSFGVILWELLTRQHFFGEIKWVSELERKVRAGDRPEIPADCPRPYQVLISKCWAQDSQDRLSFAEVLVVIAKINELLLLDLDVSEQTAGMSKVMKRPRLIGVEVRSTSLIRSGSRRGFEDFGASSRSAQQDMTGSTASAVVNTNNNNNNNVPEPVSPVPMRPRKTSEGGISSPRVSRLAGSGWRLSTVDDNKFNYVFNEVLQPVHQSAVECMLHFDNDESGGLLLSGDNDGVINIFSLVTRKLLHQFKAHSSAVLALLRGGDDTFWSSSRDGCISIWTLRVTFKEGTRGVEVALMRTLRKANKKGSFVTCMVRETDVVVCGVSDGRVIVYKGKGPKFRKRVLATLEASVSCIVICCGLCWVGVGNNIYVTNGLDSGKTFVVRGHIGPVHQLLRVGEVVWSVSSDKTCMVWGIRNGKPNCIDVVEGHSSRVFAAATDSKHYVFTAGWDKCVMAWTSTTRKFIQSLDIHHDDAISCLLWIPARGGSGSFASPVLFSGSWDGRIVAWSPTVPESTKKLVVSDSTGAQAVILGPSVVDHGWETDAPPSGSSNASSSSWDSFDFVRGLRRLGRAPSKSVGEVEPQASPVMGTGHKRLTTRRSAGDSVGKSMKK